MNEFSFHSAILRSTIQRVILTMLNWVILSFFFAGISAQLVPFWGTDWQERINLTKLQQQRQKLAHGTIVPNAVPDIFRHKVLHFNNSDDVIDRVSKAVGSSEGTCSHDLSQFLTEISKIFRPGTGSPASWALQMVDAWGKLPSGFLQGNMGDPGDFWECLNVRGEYTSLNKSVEIKGQYCRASIGLLLENADDDGSSYEFTLGGFLSPMGACFPASCSEVEIRLALDALSEALGGSMKPSVSSCMTAEKPPLDAGDYTMIIILGVITAIVVVATGTDLILQNSEKRQDSSGPKLPIKPLLAFSLYTNTRKWLSTHAGSDNLGCLHGMRFLSMSWVVLCHTWSMISLNAGNANFLEFFTWYKDWSLYPIFNGTLSVDTFFCMSGALMAYNLLRELDKKKGRLNYPLLVIHRFLRLTPTYIIIVGMMATLLPYIATGPTWFFIEQQSADCAKNWWHNLLYINNLVNYTGTGSGMCYGESWYLANDMQFFLLAPAVIYPLWRWRKIGYGILAALSLLSMISTPIIMHVKHLPPTLAPFLQMKTYMQDIYVKPWTRCGPYIVGLILGYVLYLRKKNPQKFTNIPAPFILTGWLLSTATALAIIYGPMKLFYPENQELAESAWYSLVYGGVHRYAWGVVISWIIFACVNGNGGLINDFLSWKAFIPLARLTFCMYISSYHLQMIYHASQVIHPVYLSSYGMTYWFFSHLVASGLVGYVLMIALESPFIQLERLLLSRTRSPQSEKTKAAKLGIVSTATNNNGYAEKG